MVILIERKWRIIGWTKKLATNKKGGYVMESKNNALRIVICWVAAIWAVNSSYGGAWVWPWTQLNADLMDFQAEWTALSNNNLNIRWNVLRANGANTLIEHAVQHYTDDGSITGLTPQRSAHLTRAIFSQVGVGVPINITQVRRKINNNNVVIQRDFAIPVTQGQLNAAWNAVFPNGPAIPVGGVSTNGRPIAWLHIYMTGNPANGAPNNGIKVTTVFLSDH
ncbi:MAG: hypothetical protein LBP31_00600 [Holosporales bacterium]|jgi:hypothetical protein|nr:hypothetical protein [Holosporales bacterium]